MSSVLPPLPIAAVALALGALGGVTGSQLIPNDDMAAPPAPVAQAAIVGEATTPGHGHGPRHVVHRARDGMFYVWAKANGRPVRFLVDTGASVVVLTVADAAAIGVQPGRYDGHMQTANGGTRMAWVALGEVTLGGRRVGGLRAAVLRNGPGVSLLGANLLARLGPVKIDGDRLEIG